MGEIARRCGHPADALPPLERALALRQDAGVLPTDLAFTRMVLGFVLVETGRNEPRGQKLVAQALPIFAEHHRGAQLDEIAGWRKRHPDGRARKSSRP